MKGAIYRTVNDADTLMSHVPRPGANRGVLAPMTGMCQPAVPNVPKGRLHRKPIAPSPDLVRQVMLSVPLPGANRGVLAPMTGMYQPAVPSAPKRLLRKKPIAVLPNFVKPTTQPNDPMSAEGSYNRGRGTYETAAIGAIIMLAVGAAIIWGRATR